MGRYDGSNYEGQVPMPMPQSQQRRMLAEQAEALRRQGQVVTPRTIYPPETERERYPNQPMLESDHMRQEMVQIQNALASQGYVDPVSGSNPVNYATIGLPYVYTLDQASQGFIELNPFPGAGSTFQGSITISAADDFILQAITARATREFVLTFNDNGSDRLLQSQPVSAIAWMGGLGRVFAPTVPQLVKAATVLQVTITDGGDQSPNIYNGNRVANANLEPSVANPEVLVNKIGLFLHGVRRVRRG